MAAPPTEIIDLTYQTVYTKMSAPARMYIDLTMYGDPDPCEQVFEHADVTPPLESESKAMVDDGKHPDPAAPAQDSFLRESAANLAAFRADLKREVADDALFRKIEAAVLLLSQLQYDAVAVQWVGDNTIFSVNQLPQSEHDVHLTAAFCEFWEVQANAGRVAANIAGTPWTDLTPWTTAELMQLRAYLLRCDAMRYQVDNSERTSPPETKSVCTPTLSLASTTPTHARELTQEKPPSFNSLGESRKKVSPHHFDDAGALQVYSKLADFPILRKRQDIVIELLRPRMQDPETNAPTFRKRVAPTWSKLPERWLNELPLEANDKKFIRPRPDDSLFGAFCMSLKHKKLDSVKLRKQVAAHMRAHGESIPFTLPELEPSESSLSLMQVHQAVCGPQEKWDTYCDRIAHPESTGCVLEIIALCHLFSVSIQVCHGSPLVDSPQRYLCPSITETLELGMLRPGLDIFAYRGGKRSSSSSSDEKVGVPEDDSESEEADDELDVEDIVPETLVVVEGWISCELCGKFRRRSTIARCGDNISLTNIESSCDRPEINHKILQYHRKGNRLEKRLFSSGHIELDAAFVYLLVQVYGGLNLASKYGGIKVLANCLGTTSKDLKNYYKRFFLIIAQGHQKTLEKVLQSDDEVNRTQHECTDYIFRHMSDRDQDLDKLRQDIEANKTAVQTKLFDEQHSNFVRGMLLPLRHCTENAFDQVKKTQRFVADMVKESKEHGEGATTEYLNTVAMQLTACWRDQTPHMAFVGDTRVGKSTMFDLLARTTDFLGTIRQPEPDTLQGYKLLQDGLNFAQVPSVCVPTGLLQFGEAYIEEERKFADAVIEYHKLPEKDQAQQAKKILSYVFPIGDDSGDTTTTKSIFCQRDSSWHVVLRYEDDELVKERWWRAAKSKTIDEKVNRVKTELFNAYANGKFSVLNPDVSEIQSAQADLYFEQLQQQVADLDHWRDLDLPPELASMCSKRFVCFAGCSTSNFANRLLARRVLFHASTLDFQKKRAEVLDLDDAASSAPIEEFKGALDETAFVNLRGDSASRLFGQRTSPGLRTCYLFGPPEVFPVVGYLSDSVGSNGAGHEDWLEASLAEITGLLVVSTTPRLPTSVQKTLKGTFIYDPEARATARESRRTLHNTPPEEATTYFPGFTNPAFAIVFAARTEGKAAVSQARKKLLDSLRNDVLRIAHPDSSASDTQYLQSLTSENLEPICAVTRAMTFASLFGDISAAVDWKSDSTGMTTVLGTLERFYMDGALGLLTRLVRGLKELQVPTDVNVGDIAGCSLDSEFVLSPDFISLYRTLEDVFSKEFISRLEWRRNRFSSQSFAIHAARASSDAKAACDKEIVNLQHKLLSSLRQHGVVISPKSFSVKCKHFLWNPFRAFVDSRSADWGAFEFLAHELMQRHLRDWCKASMSVNVNALLTSLAAARVAMKYPASASDASFASRLKSSIDTTVKSLEETIKDLFLGLKSTSIQLGENLLKSFRLRRRAFALGEQWLERAASVPNCAERSQVRPFTLGLANEAAKIRFSLNGPDLEFVEELASQRKLKITLPSKQAVALTSHLTPFRAFTEAVWRRDLHRAVTGDLRKGSYELHKQFVQAETIASPEKFSAWVAAPGKKKSSSSLDTLQYPANLAELLSAEEFCASLNADATDGGLAVFESWVKVYQVPLHILTPLGVLELLPESRPQNESMGAIFAVAFLGTACDGTSIVVKCSASSQLPHSRSVAQRRLAKELKKRLHDIRKSQAKLLSPRPRVGSCVKKAKTAQFADPAQEFPARVASELDISGVSVDMEVSEADQNQLEVEDEDLERKVPPSNAMPEAEPPITIPNSQVADAGVVSNFAKNLSMGIEDPLTIHATEHQAFALTGIEHQSNALTHAVSMPASSLMPAVEEKPLFSHEEQFKRQFLFLSPDWNYVSAMCLWNNPDKPTDVLSIPLELVKKDACLEFTKCRRIRCAKSHFPKSVRITPPLNQQDDYGVSQDSDIACTAFAFVFDGIGSCYHSGWASHVHKMKVRDTIARAPSLAAQPLGNFCLHALKQGHLSTLDDFFRNNNKMQGSTTAVGVVLLKHGQLHGACVGDSGWALFRPRPQDNVYCVEYVSTPNFYPLPPIPLQLSVRHRFKFDYLPPEALFVGQVQAGDCVLLFSDGVSDNLKTVDGQSLSEKLSYLASLQSPGQDFCEHMCKMLHHHVDFNARSAHGKPDDVTIVMCEVGPVVQRGRLSSRAPLAKSLEDLKMQRDWSERIGFDALRGPT